jgi:hypothetical protein
VAVELLRCLLQDGADTEAAQARGAAGAVILLREIRRIAAEMRATREVVVKLFNG